VSRRQMGQLHAPAGEERRRADEESIQPFARNRCKGCVDLPAGAGIENLDLQPHGAGCRFDVSYRGLGSLNVGWIDEHSALDLAGIARGRSWASSSSDRGLVDSQSPPLAQAHQ
jgi:hypothetical protein